MIRIDRCSYCKHKISKKGQPFKCEAFSSGHPRGFSESGGECNNGYRFEVIEERKADHDRLFSNWEKPPIKAGGIIYRSPDGRATVE